MSLEYSYRPAFFTQTDECTIEINGACQRFSVDLHYNTSGRELEIVGCELRPYIQVPHTKEERLANYEVDGRPLLDLLTAETQSDLALYLHERHERQGLDE